MNKMFDMKIHKSILGLEWETKNIKSINLQC